MLRVSSPAVPEDRLPTMRREQRMYADTPSRAGHRSQDLSGRAKDVTTRRMISRVTLL